MAVINPLTDLTGQVTRQDLFDMWANAELSDLTGRDLAADTFGIISSDSEPTDVRQPGSLWWNSQENLMYVYTDEIEGTGCSLWLAIGPDRFDCACIAAEPIPAGAVVELDHDRWIRVALVEGQAGDSNPRVIGVNQAGVVYPLNTAASSTQDSGAWVNVAIDGIVYGYAWDGCGVSALYYNITTGDFICLGPRGQHGTQGGDIISGENVPTPDFQPLGIAAYSIRGNSATSWPGNVLYGHFHWWGYRNARLL